MDRNAIFSAVLLDVGQICFSRYAIRSHARLRRACASEVLLRRRMSYRSNF
jgi:hypothetical protein